MHKNLENILRKIKGIASLSGSEIHLIIVREAGLDPRTTEKYSEFLKETGILRQGKGQDWLIDSRKIDELLTGGFPDNESYTADQS